MEKISQKIVLFLLAMVSVDFCFAKQANLSEIDGSSSVAIIFSGGGEIYSSEFFSEQVLRYTTYLENHNWKTFTLWNHQEWPEGNPVKNSLELNADIILSTLKKVFDKKPRKVLIIAINHGTKGPYHKWIMPGKGNDLDVGKVRPLLSKATNEGVMVGVIDHSCYSGNTLDQLKDSNACIFSSGGRGESTNGRFIDRMLDFLETQNNPISLQDYFSSTLCSSKSLSYPDISSLDMYEGFYPETKDFDDPILGIKDRLKPINEDYIRYLQGIDESDFLKLEKTTTCSSMQLKEGLEALLTQKEKRYFYEDSGAATWQNYARKKLGEERSTCDHFFLNK